MYLEKLTLSNFKCFAHQELPLGKITLLLGANSTGKSSLLYGILAALQSDQFPLALSANGALVNLGDFKSISYGHNKDHQVAVGLQFSGHFLGNVLFSGSFHRSLKTGMPVVSSAEISDPSFAVRVSQTERKAEQAKRYKAEWTYIVDRDPHRKLALESAGAKEFYQALGRFMREAQKVSAKSKAAATPEATEEGTFDPLALPPPSGHYAFAGPSEFFKRLAQPRYLLLGSHLGGLTSTLVDFRSAFNYIGSFRLEPQRSYYQVSKGDLKVRRDGQNYIEQIAEWQEQGAPQLTQLKRALRLLRLLSSVRTTRLRSGIFEVNVQPHNSTMSVSLADVGFGIGQLLPILVADLQLPKGSTLAVSQPEIHLHPSAQADFADYLVRRVRATKNRYLIETHSEYFFNRLRVRVAQGTLSPDDLSVIYLCNDGIQSTTYPLTFGVNGRIEGAPKEFFQTYAHDVMNIVLNADT